MLLVLLLLLFNVSMLAWAFASDQICSGQGSWVRGNLYEKMNVEYYSTDANACKMELQPMPVDDKYLANQEFTLKITPTAKRMGIKVVLLGGAKFTSPPPMSGGVLASDTCLDFDKKQTVAQVKFLTPSVGERVTVKALCGTYQEMHVASEIELYPGDGVKRPQLVRSQDPDYSYEQELLQNRVVLRHSKNHTHLSVAIEYRDVGYVSFGLGKMMVGSLVLIGINPAYNAGMKPIGMYKLVNENPVGGNVEVEGDMYENAGIVHASYEVLANGYSMLKFIQEIEQPNKMFNLVSGSNSVVWAVGPRKYKMHYECGSVDDFTMSSNAAAVESSSKEEDGDIVAASDDAEFTFMKQLNDEMTIYYKKNGTHGTIKLVKHTGGYLALGCGTRMVSSTVLIGMDISINPDYQSALAMYTITSMSGELDALASTPEQLKSRFGLHDLYYVATEDNSMLGFTMELANQAAEFTLFNNGKVNLVYAGGPEGGDYMMHPFGSVLRDVDLSHGAIAAPAMPPLLLVHIVAMLLAWTVCIPLALGIKLFPRFVNLKFQRWLQAHTMFACLGVLFTIIGLITSVKYVDEKRGVHWYDLHGKLGLGVAFVAFAQPIFGFGRHLIPRNKFTLFHIGTGFTLVITAQLNNLLGISSLQRTIGGVSSLLGFTIALLSLFAVFLVAFAAKQRCMDTQMRRKHSESENSEDYVAASAAAVDGQFNGIHKRKPPATSNEDGGGGGAQLEMSLLTPSTPLVSTPPTLNAAISPPASMKQTISAEELAASPNLTLFNGSSVYDFTSYLQEHPGGADIILAAGKDIAAAFSEQGHSKKAIKLLKSYYVGELHQ